jgi:hypothetical protein
MLPIPGTSKVAHLEANVAAVNIQLSDEEFDVLNREGQTEYQQSWGPLMGWTGRAPARRLRAQPNPRSTAMDRKALLTPRMVNMTR